MSDEREQSEERLSQLFQRLRADEDPNPAFADALFAQLEDEASPRRSRGRTWMLLAAAVLVASLATGAVFGSGLVRVPWLIADADGTPDPTATAEPTPSESETPSATPEPTPGPTATAPPVAADFVARVAVAGLTLRDAPGLDADSLGTFDEGQVGLVIAGPVVADGYDWYRFSGLGLPPNSGCAFPIEEDPLGCPTWFGWVAAASQDGHAWIEPTSLVCPESPMSMQTLALARGDVERLACHHDGPITVRGWWPELTGNGLGGACASGPPSGWLYCQNINHNLVVIDETEDIALKVTINPDSGVTMPDRGQWIEVVGHYDDPAAQGCDENAALNGGLDEDPDRIVLTCRTHLVVESARPVNGPY